MSTGFRYILYKLFYKTLNISKQQQFSWHTALAFVFVMLNVLYVHKVAVLSFYLDI